MATLAALLSAVAIAVLALAGPAAAQSPPGVATGGAARVTASTATLTGSVDPNGLRTRYFFEYGPTRAYGSRTPVQLAGSGTRVVTAIADVGGLAAATRYHFRLVARNREGSRRGRDRTFRTRRQPLALTLTATPNPVRFGAGTTLSGNLSGTGSRGRRVVLEAANFPFTAFAPVGNPAVTDALGNFAIGVATLGISSHFRVRTLGRRVVFSPTVPVGVRVRVATRVSVSRTAGRRRVVRFSGRVAPARPRAPFAIQKRKRGGRWVTIAGGRVGSRGTVTSRYAKGLRLRRGGRFRVFVGVTDAAYLPGTGRTVRVRLP